MEKKDYLSFIAYLQIIGIILVVFGHSFHEFPDGRHGFSLFIYRLFYTFRMPLFLFVSGFLMIYTTKVDAMPTITPKKFILNKVKRLMLPMIVLTAVTFVPRALLSFAADDQIQLTFKSFFLGFIHIDYLPIPYFWFLHVSFILLCLSFTVLYIGNKLRIDSGITILILLALLLFYAFSDLPASNYFSLKKIKQLGFFFILGGGYAIYYDYIDGRVPWTKPWFLAINMILWVLSFIFFEKTPAVYLSSLTGIMSFVCIAKIIESKKWGFLDHLKGANYLIFLLSWYCNVFSQQVLAHYFILPWWIHTLLSLVAGVYVPWLGYRYLQSHRESRWIKVTAFLLGQSFKNKK